MTTTYHTSIATGANANASVFNAPLGQLDAQIVSNVAALAVLQTLLNIKIDEAVAVITANTIAFTKTGTSVVPETGTIDNLDTITGGSPGDIIFITVDDDADIVNVTNIGNIEMPYQTVVLNNENSILALRKIDTTTWAFMFAGNCILNPFVKQVTIAAGGIDLSAAEYKFSTVIKIRGEGFAADDLQFITPNAMWGDGYQLILKKASTENITVKQNSGAINPKFFITSDRVLDNTRDNLIVQLGGTGGTQYWENMGFNDNGT